MVTNIKDKREKDAIFLSWIQTIGKFLTACSPYPLNMAITTKKQTNKQNKTKQTHTKNKVYIFELEGLTSLKHVP